MIVTAIIFALMPLIGLQLFLALSGLALAAGTPPDYVVGDLLVLQLAVAVPLKHVRAASNLLILGGTRPDAFTPAG